MASGLLSLKWNHHRSTFLHVLANIRQKESYCDVTLACAGKFYSAHKLVLSTCSEYFEEMFERTQCKHPVIVLKDIGADELEALLSYMYDGEVNVLQENLSSLIKAAECLKIKGLAVADSDPSEHSSKSTKDKSSSSSSNSNGKDVHRSHNSNSTSNSNNHSFQSDSSSRQFRNSSGGVKRPSLSSKQDDGPSKRRRPEPSSLSSAAASPARRQSTERPSSAPRGGTADAKDGDDGGSDGADGGEDGGNSMEGTPSAADDQPHEDGGPEDARSFAQGLSEQTGVKAEPVEIIDSDDMGGFDPQTGDGGSHDASDAEFTEEKFASGGADANDPSLWGGGANNDMFSQPSTSSFTGQDGSNSNDNNSGGGKGGGGGSSMITMGWNNSSRNRKRSSDKHSDSATHHQHHHSAQAKHWHPDQEVTHDPSGVSSPPYHDRDQPPHQRRPFYRSPQRESQREGPNQYEGSPGSFPPSDSFEPSGSNASGGQTGDCSFLQQIFSVGGGGGGVSSDNSGMGVTLPPHSGTYVDGGGGLPGTSYLNADACPSDALYARSFDSESRLADYNCLVCNYRSKKLCNMKAHVRTHNQEKPFPCPRCSYRANQMSNLKAHVFRHHNQDFPVLFKEASRVVY